MLVDGPRRRLTPADATALAEEGRQELISLLAGLIGAPSPYGSSARRAQDRLGDYLERNRFAVETREDQWAPLRDHPEFSAPPPDAAPAVNLISTPAGSSGLTLFAHVDTEPPGEGWTVPPLAVTLRGARAYGLGAADDKGGLAAAAVAAVLVHRCGLPAPAVASVHGKGGGARGTLPVVLRGAGAGDWLYVHPPENGAGLAVLKHASRGLLDVELRATGWSGRPREIGTPDSAPFAEGGDALAALLRVVETLRRGELADCELNLGRIAAGEAPGRTPVHCEAALRVLFGGERTAAEVLAAVRRAAEPFERPDPAHGRSFRFRITSAGVRANPAATDWNAPLAEAVRSAVAGITGAEPAPYAGHLASDIRFPIRIRGRDSVGIGSRAGNFYGPDEWVDLDDLVRLVAVLVLVGSRWAAPG